MNNTHNIIIHTHLGMGDMFICNGLIRKLISESDYENYYVVCKKKYSKTIEKMYLDEEKITVVSIDGNNEYQEVRDLNIQGAMLRIGHEHLNYNRNFDESFYEQLGYRIEDKFKWCKISRNDSQETECHKEEVKNEEYIFVHDKSSVGEFELKIKTDYDVVKPNNMDYDVVDYLKVIENAKEIHCLDSSFLNMIDVVPTTTPCFFHRIKNTQFPTISKKWKVVNYDEVMQND